MTPNVTPADAALLRDIASVIEVADQTHPELQLGTFTEFTRLRALADQMERGHCVPVPTPAMIEAAARGIYEHQQGGPWNEADETDRSHYTYLATRALTAAMAVGVEDTRGSLIDGGER